MALLHDINLLQHDCVCLLTLKPTCPFYIQGSLPVASLWPCCMTSTCCSMSACLPAHTPSHPSLPAPIHMHHSPLAASLCP